MELPSSRKPLPSPANVEEGEGSGSQASQAFINTLRSFRNLCRNGGASLRKKCRNRCLPLPLLRAKGKEWLPASEPGAAEKRLTGHNGWVASALFSAGVDKRIAWPAMAWRHPSNSNSPRANNSRLGRGPHKQAVGPWNSSRFRVPGPSQVVHGIPTF